MTIRKKITSYVKAGYPILGIQTLEETRTLGILKEVADERKRELLVFSETRGIVDFTTNKTDATVHQATEFVERIFENKNKGIYVMLDMDEYLEKDIVLQRCIKDRVPELRQQGKIIVLVSSVMRTGPIISQFVTRIETTLPTRDELEVLYDTPEDSNHQKLVPVDTLVAIKDPTITALSGLTLDEASDAIALSRVEKGGIDPTFIMQSKAENLARHRFLKVIPREQLPTIDQVGGLENLKAWVMKRRNVFSKEAREYGLPTIKGVALAGISGCGKSLAAKAIGAFLGIPVVKLDFPSVLDSYVGNSERNMRIVTQVSEAMAPCVLWVDELDKMFSTGQGGQNQSHEVSKHTMEKFLDFLQEKTSPVFVICTLNNIEGIIASNPELLRAVRFDAVFFVDVPSDDARREIFQIHIQKQGRRPQDFDIGLLADISQGFSGAEIEGAVNSAMFTAFSDNGHDINTDYIAGAVRATNPMSKTAKTTNDRIREFAATNCIPASAPTTINVNKTRNIE